MLVGPRPRDAVVVLDAALTAALGEQVQGDFLPEAERMPKLARALLIEGVAPSSVSPADLLDDLGMSVYERSLSQRAIASDRAVLGRSGVLSPEACAKLRAAVDSERRQMCDSVDGAPDHQLNLSRVELEGLIGTEEVRRVWAMATRALVKLRPNEYGDDEEDESAEALLDAHEIFVRVYTPHTRPWFPFHKDRSELTVNIALSDDNGHTGGRL